jgi:hypothetical protein
MFYKIEKYCRACGATNLEQVLPFGKTPLAGSSAVFRRTGKARITCPFNTGVLPELRACTNSGNSLS